MQDRIATMMILGSLRDIADEVRTLRQELRRLECAAAREPAAPSRRLSDNVEEAPRVERFAPRTSRRE